MDRDMLREQILRDLDRLLELTGKCAAGDTSVKLERELLEQALDVKIAIMTGVNVS